MQLGGEQEEEEAGEDLSDDEKEEEEQQVETKPKVPTRRKMPPEIKLKKYLGFSYEMRIDLRPRQRWQACQGGCQSRG